MVSCLRLSLNRLPQDFYLEHKIHILAKCTLKITYGSKFTEFFTTLPQVILTPITEFMN